MTRRVLGTAFIGLLCFLLWLTYAFYAKVFVDTVDVKLQTSHIGLQLNRHADVKLRGIIVGEVRSVVDRRRDRDRRTGAEAGPGQGDLQPGQRADPAEDAVRREVRRARPAAGRGGPVDPGRRRDLPGQDGRRHRDREGAERRAAAAAGGRPGRPERHPEHAGHGAGGTRQRDRRHPHPARRLPEEAEPQRAEPDRGADQADPGLRSSTATRRPTWSGPCATSPSPATPWWRRSSSCRRFFTDVQHAVDHR